MLQYVLHRDQISTRMNTYGKFWTDSLDSNHQICIFRKMTFILSVHFQRLVECSPRGTEAGAVTCGDPTPYVDSSICHMYVYTCGLNIPLNTYIDIQIS